MRRINVEGKPFCFELIPAMGEKIFQIAANSEAELKEWMAAIGKAEVVGVPMNVKHEQHVYVDENGYGLPWNLSLLSHTSILRRCVCVCVLCVLCGVWCVVCDVCALPYSLSLTRSLTNCSLSLSFGRKAHRSLEWSHILTLGRASTRMCACAHAHANSQSLHPYFTFLHYLLYPLQLRAHHCVWPWCGFHTRSLLTLC